MVESLGKQCGCGPHRMGVWRAVGSIVSTVLRTQCSQQQPPPAPVSLSASPTVGSVACEVEQDSTLSSAALKVTPLHIWNSKLEVAGASLQNHLIVGHRVDILALTF